jgi:hypothetical protein
MNAVDILRVDGERAPDVVDVLCEAFRLPVMRSVLGPNEADYASSLRRLVGLFVAARVNRLLERAKGYREVVVTKNGMQVMERCRIDSADQLSALVATQVAFLIATEQPALVKHRAPG